MANFLNSGRHKCIMAQKEKPKDEAPPPQASSTPSAASQDLNDYQQTKTKMREWLTNLKSERGERGYNFQLQIGDAPVPEGVLPGLTQAAELKTSKWEIDYSVKSREAYRDEADAAKLIAQLDALPDKPANLKDASGQLLVIAVNGIRLQEADYYRHWHDGLQTGAKGTDRQLYLEGALATVDALIEKLPAYYEAKGGEAPFLKGGSFEPLRTSLENARADFNDALIAEQQGKRDVASAKIKSGLKAYDYFDNRFGALSASAEEDRELVKEYGHAGAFFVKHGESIMSGLVFLGGMAGRASKTPVGQAAYMTMELYFAAHGAGDIINRYVSEGSVPLDIRTIGDISMMALPAGTLGKLGKELPETQRFLDMVSKTGGGVLMVSAASQGGKLIFDARGVLSGNEVSQLFELGFYTLGGFLVAERGKGVKPEKQMSDFYEPASERAPRSVSFDATALEEATGRNSPSTKVSGALSDISSRVGEADSELREMLRRAQQGVDDISRIPEGRARELSYDQMATLIKDLRAFSEQKPKEYGSLGKLADWMDSTYASRLNMESVAPRETPKSDVPNWSNVANDINGAQIYGNNPEKLAPIIERLQKAQGAFESDPTYSKLIADTLASIAPPDVSAQAQVPAEPVRIFESGQLAQVETAQALIASQGRYASIELANGNVVSGRLSLIAGEDKVYRLGIGEGQFSARYEFADVKRIAVLNDISQLPYTELGKERLTHLNSDDAKLLLLNAGNGARITMKDGTVLEGALAFERAPGHPASIGIEGSNRLYDLRNVESIRLLNGPNLFAQSALAEALPAASSVGVRAPAASAAVEAVADPRLDYLRPLANEVNGTPNAAEKVSAIGQAYDTLGPRLMQQFEALVMDRIKSGESWGTRSEIEGYANFLRGTAGYSAADFARAEQMHKSFASGAPVVDELAFAKLGPVFGKMGMTDAVELINFFNERNAPPGTPGAETIPRLPGAVDESLLPRSIRENAPLTPEAKEMFRQANELLERGPAGDRLPTAAEYAEITASHAKWRNALGLAEGAALDSPEAKARMQQIISTLPEGVRLDMRGMPLSDMDFSGRNLAGFDFSYSNLQGANFRGAQLGATFFAADISGADFTGARFKGDDFGGAIANAAGRPTIFDGADLSGATFSGADFAGASMRRAILRDANLDGTLLPGALLTGTDLRNAHVNPATTDISGADLRGAENIPEQMLGLARRQGAITGEFPTVSQIFDNGTPEKLAEVLELKGVSGGEASFAAELMSKRNANAWQEIQDARAFRTLAKKWSGSEDPELAELGGRMLDVTERARLEVMGKTSEAYRSVEFTAHEWERARHIASGQELQQLYDVAQKSGDPLAMQQVDKAFISRLNMMDNKIAPESELAQLNKLANRSPNMDVRSAYTKFMERERDVSLDLVKGEGPEAEQAARAKETNAFYDRYSIDKEMGLANSKFSGPKTFGRPVPEVQSISALTRVKLEWGVLTALSEGTLTTPELMQKTIGRYEPPSQWERSSPNEIGPLEVQEMVRGLQRKEMRLVTADENGIRLTRLGRQELDVLNGAKREGGGTGKPATVQEQKGEAAKAQELPALSDKALLGAREMLREEFYNDPRVMPIIERYLQTVQSMQALVRGNVEGLSLEVVKTEGKVPEGAVMHQPYQEAADAGWGAKFVKRLEHDDSFHTWTMPTGAKFLPTANADAVLGQLKALDSDLASLSKQIFELKKTIYAEHGGSNVRYMLDDDRYNALSEMLRVGQYSHVFTASMISVLEQNLASGSSRFYSHEGD